MDLLNRSGAGRIQGCVRLLPSTGPTMLGDIFPILLDASRRHEAIGSGEQPIRARCSRGCAEGERRTCCCQLRAVCGHD
ncbi:MULTISPECIES: acyl-homoserine-lactone synthase [unclassified Bradyrhizobium]|uniref:acyl-homoserine-lactone synthase n=1 Tax=unclassified Bradyrhizobium TaxID=2631580 RepID=UPI0031F77F8A